jgi:hypothetical protein
LLQAIEQRPRRAGEQGKHTPAPTRRRSPSANRNPLQDFFYVCPTHLKDRNFCTPIIDHAAIEAKRKKELEEEIERVKKDYEEKQKKKKEKEKEKDKEKEDSKDKDKDKDKKDDKDKSEKNDKTTGDTADKASILGMVTSVARHMGLTTVFQ